MVSSGQRRPPTGRMRLGKMKGPGLKQKRKVASMAQERGRHSV